MKAESFILFSFQTQAQKARQVLTRSVQIVEPKETLIHVKDSECLTCEKKIISKLTVFSQKVDGVAIFSGRKSTR